MTASAAAETPGQPDGTVTGTPRRWLRLEGAVLLAGSLIAYSATRQPWWLVPLALLAPDLLMVGYFHGTRLGGTAIQPCPRHGAASCHGRLGWWQSRPLVVALGLIWLAHMGIDRLFGYGLLISFIFLVPAYPATSIVREKNQGTLALLLNTPMRPWSIYFGKLLGVLGFAFLPLIMSLPAAAACYTMGGISLQR